MTLPAYTSLLVLAALYWFLAHCRRGGGGALGYHIRRSEELALQDAIREATDDLTRINQKWLQSSGSERRYWQDEACAATRKLAELRAYQLSTYNMDSVGGDEAHETLTRCNIRVTKGRAVEVKPGMYKWVEERNKRG